MILKIIFAGRGLC